MDNFEAMRRLATTLGVACPESNDEIFNVAFINTLNRFAKKAIKKDDSPTFTGKELTCIRDWYGCLFDYDPSLIGQEDTVLSNKIMNIIHTET